MVEGHLGEIVLERCNVVLEGKADAYALLVCENSCQNSVERLRIAKRLHVYQERHVLITELEKCGSLRF